ncbi:MAG: fibronectin type III domain-containing protein [Acidobacteria bacterium]|nr:fibronectin type III domain-containing protein [Acidobacteriota bacterium]
MYTSLYFVSRPRFLICLLLLLATTIPASAVAQVGSTALPAQIPPRRSSLIRDGLGGVNTSLPRPPYLPWNRWWWTRIFDAGFKWVRIGQYEDSSDQTSWDWVERERGHFAISPRVDEFVNSLVDNGTTIELQLLYGNPMYTAPAGVLPNSIVPAPATVHNPDHSLYSIFWPPKTAPQIDAFIKYTEWMVNHFRGRIHYYSLWNEENGGYWDPRPNPKEYGRLLKAFIPAVHHTDPSAKVVFGGLSHPGTDFPKEALEGCQCASGIDVFAYHTYPGNKPPESVDSGAFGVNSPKALRKMVRSFPGIRPDIQFWDDEYSQPSVQAKYFPRMLVYNGASNIPTFIWELINDTSSDEGDDYGIIHGMMYHASDFEPRPVFGPLQNTNAVFADTKRDRSIEISVSNKVEMERAADAPFFAYAFRSRQGKVIVAYWLGAASKPGVSFAPRYTTMKLRKTGICHPVLINIDSGKISRLRWAHGTSDTIDKLPVLDSVLVVADESYFDWPVLPETPSSLRAAASGRSVRLTWAVHGEEVAHIAVEREYGYSGRWERIATLPANATAYVDTEQAKGITSYRVRALSKSGESAYSNIVNVSEPN